MDRRDLLKAGLGALPVAAITTGALGDDEKKEAAKEPKTTSVWKVVNVGNGQTRPEELQQVLNDLESKGYHIIGVEPIYGNQVQIYARTRPNFMFSDSIASDSIRPDDDYYAAGRPLGLCVRPKDPLVRQHPKRS